MTKQEVVRLVGLPAPRSKRESIWDDELGGTSDPVYRFILDGDRVVKVKRFDGFAVVDDSEGAPRVRTGP